MEMLQCITSGTNRVIKTRDMRSPFMREMQSSNSI